ncbi:MAG TPA: type VI secretion system baseplate subunit TssK [Gemmatimonadaceae bacterium]|jgi:type VI secretion system protein ImpJ
MRQMQPVLWTKGVLLSPQHFQTQDRFLEDLLEFQLSSLVFSPWGFRRLEIDREALAGGSFAIASASGIFPDGLLFDMPLSDPTPPPKQLEGAFAQDQETLDVYLSIPEYRYGGHNVSAAQRERDTRYRAEELLRRDETTGRSERPIQVARKNFRILFEGESAEGSTILRAARLTRTTTGDYQLSSAFVPPLIDVEASEYVMAIARRLIEILSAKSTQLSGMRRQKNQSLADFGIADVASFWLLYTVNSHLPLLRHLYETRRGHPVALFEMMLELAGALTTFSMRIHPRDLPAYEHDELGACFTKLDEQLRELLETVVPASTVSIPLRVVQPSVHAAALDQDKYLAAPQIFLAVSSSSTVPANELVQRVPSLLKVSAAGQLDHLIRQALAGIALTYVPTPPTAVPVKLNYHYFLLQKAGPEWEAVSRARNIAAYVPAGLGDVQLELVVLLGAKG